MADLLAAPGATFYSVLEQADSGLVGTVGVRVIDRATAQLTTARTTTGITELVGGSGIYVAALTAPPIGRYAIVWDTGSVTPQTTATDDLVVSNDVVDGAVSLSAARAVPIEVISPVAENGDITVVTGDDYNSHDGRAWDFTNANGTWPDLTNATIRIIVMDPKTRDTALNTTGTVVVATGQGQKVRFQPTAAQTAAFRAGRRYVHATTATLASGAVATLALGDVRAHGNPL